MKKIVKKGGFPNKTTIQSIDLSVPQSKAAGKVKKIPC